MSTLYYSASSPYARKVRIVAHELGINGQLKLVRPDVRTDPAFHAISPTRRIPALVLADGTVFVESRVIADYLIFLAGNPLPYAQQGPARFVDLQHQALGDGLADWAVPLRHERLRPAAQQSAKTIDRSLGAIDGILNHLASICDRIAVPTLGAFSVACALDYLDFRFPQLDWRRSRDELSAWHAGIAQRPSMRATAFVADAPHR